MKVVENAIIVPIFTMIIIALISVGIYMHDRIIIRNIVLSAAYLSPLFISSFLSVISLSFSYSIDI